MLYPWGLYRELAPVVTSRNELWPITRCLADLLALGALGSRAACQQIESRNGYREYRTRREQQSITELYARASTVLVYGTSYGTSLLPLSSLCNRGSETSHILNNERVHKPRPTSS